MQTADSELHLQDGILKNQIKMFMRAVNLYTFLRNCLRVEPVLCQTHRTWPKPQDGEPNIGMENIFSAQN